MAEVFKANDAVALAFYFGMLIKDAHKDLTDVKLNNAKVEELYDGITKQIVQLKEQDRPAEVKDLMLRMMRDTAEALRKLKDQGTFKKVADVNDDLGPNAVDVNDLLGFIKPDIYVSIQAEGTDKSKFLKRMEHRCPKGFSLLQNAETQKAFDSCKLEINGKHLNAEERKELGEFVNYSGILYLFGYDYNNIPNLISNVYGQEGMQYYDRSKEKLMKEINSWPTRIPTALLPYFEDSIQSKSI